MTLSRTPAPFLSTFSRQLGYVCSRCRLRARLSSIPSHSGSISPSVAAASIRHLTTSGRSRSLDASLGSTPPPPPPLPAGVSSIRNHLRAWTIQNQDIKAQAAEDIYSGTGTKRLTTLPNSLFTETSRVDDEGSEEYLDQDQEQDIIDGNTLRHSLRPGDLIFCRSPQFGSREQFAIYLGHEGLQLQYFLSDGRWLVDRFVHHHSPVIKAFATPDEVQQIRAHLPKQEIVKKSTILSLDFLRSWVGEVPRSASDALLSRMAYVTDEISSFRRDNIALIDSIIDKVSHDEHYQTLDWDQVVHKVMACTPSELSPAATMAIFFALQKDPTHIQVLRSPRTGTLWFIVVSKRSASRFENVRDWGRDYQEAAAQAALGKDVKDALENNPLTSFIDKARRIILKSRKIRSPTTTGHLGPSMVPLTDENVTHIDTGETFSDNDQMIIEFLWDTCMRTPVENRVRTIYNSVASVIIRAIGAYPKLRLERKIGRLLMQELGVISPWTDAFAHDLLYPSPDTIGADDLHNLRDRAQASCEELWPDQTGYVPELDSMASLRRNFDLPAFCVDGESTTLRDDAYSLEPNDAIPGTYWVHVHVSHLSAFITPDHPAAQLASEIMQSSYTVNAVLPMLPHTLANSMSLQSDRPALTVSTLLTEEGEVLDVKLQPTMLKNVVILNNKAVNINLGDHFPEFATFQLGASTDGNLTESSSKPSQAAVNAAQVHHATLKQIDNLMRKRILARTKPLADVPDWPLRSHEVSVRSHVREMLVPDKVFQSRHFLDEPSIYCFASPAMKIVKSSDRVDQDDITSRVMALAAESAGKWFADRNIPAIFSCAVPQADFPVSKLNELGFDARRALPQAYYSSTPRFHVYTSIEGYLRFTSPLRRYTDLLAHWQADAFLRAESESSSNSTVTVPQDKFPFSKTQVDREVVRFTDWSDIMKKKMVRQALFWRLRALFRAFHFKEADLPERWDMLVRNVAITGKRSEDDTLIRGSLLPFAYETVLLESRNKWEADATLNCYLPVKIELVDLSTGKVICRAVGPPQATPQFPTPLHIVPRSTDREQTTGS